MSQNPGPERLQKVIARSGLASRRAAEEMIEQGRVVVDGEVASIGQKVDAARQQIAIDGIPLPTAPGLVHWLLHKPAGVVSTASDPQGRPTVVDLVPAEPRVFPVGRLDADSTGLLLLTNDGDLTNLVTHPRHGVTKTYEVLVEGRVPERLVRRLSSGVELEDGPAAAISARVIDGHGDRTHLELVMGEGRNREVRRMCDELGHPVIRLHRSAIGPVRDRSLPEGSWRALTVDEVRSLYAAATMGADEGESG